MSTLPNTPTILQSAPEEIKHIADLAEFVARKLDPEGYKVALVAVRSAPGNDEGVELLCLASIPPHVLAPLFRQYATSIEVASGKSPAS
ncbi:MAG TPA: hypothetical protein PK788_07640 [Gemmatimonadaceae bacterium]|nr:hypothetical protein [Gemmatimonadaceae bacterium]